MTGLSVLSVLFYGGVIGLILGTGAALVLGVDGPIWSAWMGGSVLLSVGAEQGLEKCHAGAKRRMAIARGTRIADEDALLAQLWAEGVA